jgi:putative secretion ATPase (PEP-CTERM system associated)
MRLRRRSVHPNNWGEPFVMYERFYNLRERPFSLSPDPDYLYPSRVHREALSYLRYGIEGHAGFIVITGEIGSGKTTLLQAALRGLDRQTSVSRLVNTMLDARELIEAVMLDFGLEPGQGRSKPHLLRDLARYLVEQRSAGRLALLVIDEAQNLSLPALEEVRMLSNLETEKSKLVQIVLIGQPNLRDVLGRPELEQLRQRVTVRYHLQPLDSEETCAYVNHRLRRAALGAPLEFSRDVTDLIHLHSQGLPRKINVIADAVLLFGYGEERRTIDVDLTQEVLEELEATGVIAPPSYPLSVPGAVEPPTPGAAAVTTHELETREARVVQRERQLVEQQRILEEEYRLLRRHAEGPSDPPSEPARAGWTTAVPAATPPAPSLPLNAAPAPSEVAASAAPLADALPLRPAPVPPIAAAPIRPAPVRTPAPAVRVAAPGIRYSAAARLRREPVAPESMWTRLRRGLFGQARSLWDE